MKRPTIVAIGGGGCGLEPENAALDNYLHDLTAQERPRVCFIPTASGDNDAYLVRFYGAFRHDRWVPTHLPLFHRTHRDLEELLLTQDVIYVGGGNTAAMLAIWRQHGVDRILHEAWQRGILLCGVSAGANCWFQACSTDSFGLDLDPLTDGLGFLPGSFCPHYDGEERRRPTLKAFIEAQQLTPGWAADNHVALKFEDTEFVEAVTSRSGRAYKVGRAGSGVFDESAIDTRRLA